ncbi:long-chain fatty acid transport protein 2-like [Diadema antillarum]|uniref:long-chain fatty acid transport protein 2-like n=1 Tax=Diadema antillarum TaxID=105358 RepID=UPI003A8C6811
MAVGFCQTAVTGALISVLVGCVWIQLKLERGEQGVAIWDLCLLAAAATTTTLLVAYTWLRINYTNWFEDVKYFLNLVKWNSSIQEKMKSGQTILDVLDRHVYHKPDHPCILFNDEVYTYSEVDRQANRVARWVMNRDPSLQKGDAICLLLHNGPVFAWTCLGLMKAGIVVSLLNTNLKPAALIYCMQASEAKKIIFGSDFLPVVEGILPELLELGIDAWLVNDDNKENIKSPREVVTMETSHLPKEPYARDAYSLTDLAIYIFTSGTTGMPKPVVVLHRKIIRSTYLHFFSNITPDDVYYVALPLYHSAALLQGVFSVWYYGGTVAVAKKFSATRFWDDIRQHRATGFHYIGEICRYLLAQPKKSNDGIYPRKIRFAQGNGLRPEIWREFQERFKVGKLFEIYAATEGNFGFINIDGKVGTVGRYPWFLKTMKDDVEIVDYDYGSGEPKRGEDGLCVLLQNGQTGLALSKVNENSPYTGYKGPEIMSKRKLVSGVKQTGDVYFNTGDLLMIDHDGYVYFKDRVGDTFRWKGENVSTTEVSQVINTFDAILEANVYGVTVPDQDGRAGMAAVVLRAGHHIDWHALYAHIRSCLPSYACPKFVRVMDQMDITSTFKHKKTTLVKEGFDIEIMKDDIFIIDTTQETFVPMTKYHSKLISNGTLKL